MLDLTTKMQQKTIAAIYALTDAQRDILATLIEQHIDEAGDTALPLQGSIANLRESALVSPELTAYLNDDMDIDHVDFGSGNILLSTDEQERFVYFVSQIKQQGLIPEAAEWLAGYHLEDEKEAGMYLNNPDFQHWDEYASIEELAIAADVREDDKTGITIDDIRDESGRECYQVSSSLFLLNTES